MTAFDYSVIDGAEVPVRHLIRGKDLGLDGSTQIIGHVFSSDELGEIADTAATDHTVSATAIALMKAILRDIGNVSGGASFTEGSVTDASVLQAESVIATIDCRGQSTLGVTLENTGANALASFNVDTRTNSSLSGYQREANYAGAYAADSSASSGNSTILVIRAGANNPFTLASSASTWVRLNVKGIESVQLIATGDGGDTTVSANWLVE